MSAARGQTRRKFLSSASAAGVGLALSGSGASARILRRGRRPTVAILGGGVGGLSAAHELVERGFRVTVYETNAWGGKARSMGVPGSAPPGRLELPGEHGARWFPGIYRNLPETMKRIPLPSGGTAFDNLTSADQISFSRSGGRYDVIYPVGLRPWTPEQITENLISAFEHFTRVPPEEVARFARALTKFMTSSPERRYGQWEYVSWLDFIGARNASEEYRRYYATALTRNIVAARADLASARSIGIAAEALVFNLARRSEGQGDYDRVLNAPTNEAWIDPWVAHLKSKGVRFRLGWKACALELDGRRIAGAQLRRRKRRATIAADYFVSAIPVERARRLFGHEMLRADPALRRLKHLRTAWQGGMQFFLDRELPLIHGHISYIDSPWNLASISQQQFWPNSDLDQSYGDGTVHDCLSVTISAWDEPGLLYSRPARDLQPQQIADEVLAQIQAHLNDEGEEVLSKEMVRRWFLEPAFKFPPGRPAKYSEPLVIDVVGSWDNRPTAATKFGNLFLAADFVRNGIGMATMEGANDAARQAVNALLDRADSTEVPCPVFSLYAPPEFEAAKAEDAARFRRGEPHVMDAGGP